MLEEKTVGVIMDNYEEGGGMLLSFHWKHAMHE